MKFKEAMKYCYETRTVENNTTKLSKNIHKVSLPKTNIWSTSNTYKSCTTCTYYLWQFYTFQTFDIGIGLRSPTTETLNPYNFCTWCPNDVLFSALDPFDLAKKKYHNMIVPIIETMLNMSLWILGGLTLNVIDIHKLDLIIT